MHSNLKIQTAKKIPDFLLQFSSVPQSSQALCNPWTIEHLASLSIINSQGLFKLMSIELPSHPLLSPFPTPSVFPSIRVFSNESVLCNRWQVLKFQFSITPFNEYSGLISFRMDWLDLLAVQETLKRLLQHDSFKSINSSVSDFFTSNSHVHT